MLPSTYALLAAIVDYAGTFPPASLTLADALAEYARARAGADAWLLGRFVIPWGNLQDFERLAPRVISHAGGDHWDLSVIVPANAAQQLGRLEMFNEQWRGTARVASVEFPPLPTPHIAALAGAVPEGLEMFFETPIGTDLGTQLRAMKAVGATAKVRTGGVTADVVPTPEELARFLNCAGEADVAFKATAGLHHATRGCYPLTYEAGSDTGTMHGFLNLAAAAANLRSGGSSHDTLKVLLEPSPDAFEFRADGLCWRGLTIGIDDLADTRRRFFRSFGACAVRESADDLRRLQLS